MRFPSGSVLAAAVLAAAGRFNVSFALAFAFTYALAFAFGRGGAAPSSAVGGSSCALGFIQGTILALSTSWLRSRDRFLDFPFLFFLPL